MYSYETIGPGICLAVSRAHTFGTDAVLLAHFAHARKNDKMIDLGTGCGIIPFYIAAAGPYPERIDCADIQPDAVEQVRHSVEKTVCKTVFSPKRQTYETFVPLTRRAASAW